MTVGARSPAMPETDMTEHLEREHDISRETLEGQYRGMWRNGIEDEWDEFLDRNHDFIHTLAEDSVAVLE